MVKVIKASYEIKEIFPNEEAILKWIEECGRISYRSEENITDESAFKFVTDRVEAGHFSIIEHAGASVKFICDRGVTHELVRHRLASYTQESTRFVDYSSPGEITVIRPCFWVKGSTMYMAWREAMIVAEAMYMNLRKEGGAKPEEARSVLPNSLKTEIMVTANIREWRHILDLRCHPSAHPQMREVMKPLLIEFHERVPVLFDDIYQKRITEVRND